MDVVQAESKNVDSGDEAKMTENTPMTEDFEKIGGSYFDSRYRRRSKYLSYPYTNSGPRPKDLPVETEDLRTPCLAHKAEASSRTTKPSNRTPSFAKLGSKRFRRNWYKKFISCSSMSSSPEFINASSDELLSGLCSKAVDCMFPIENKNFDLVEWFFCRYRILEYHDEAELATSLVNENGVESGKPVGNDLLDTKSEKKRKNNKMENAVRRKMKSLSGLSDMNIDVSTGDSLKSGRKLKQKRKVEEVTPLHQLQNAETTLNESSNKNSSAPEAPQNLSCLTSEGKARPKKREKIEAAKEHEGAQFPSYGDAESTKCSSLVIDLQLAPPPIPVDIHEKSNGENKKELVLIDSNPEIRVSQEELVGNVTNHNLSVSTASEVGTASQEGHVGNITNHSLSVNTASEVGTVSHEGLVGNVTNHNLSVSTASEVGTASQEGHVGNVTNHSFSVNTASEVGTVSHEGLVGNVINHNLLGNTASKVGTASQEGLVGNISNHSLLVNTASEVGTVSQKGLVGNITNHNLLGNTASEVGTVSKKKKKTGLKNRMEKAAEERPNTKHAIEIPDLNSAIFETCSIRKEFETVNFFSLELKSEQSRSLSTCSRSSKTINLDRVDDNGESPGTCLFLQFAPGVCIPSKDDLLTTFCRFGPLKASETQLMKDTGRAQIVFVRSTDAGEAFHSLEQNKPFGATLVDYKLHHPPAVCPPVVQLVTPTQPTRPMSMPGEAPPPLQFIKQNLQMMTSILENSGNNLSPQMRAKLDTEIKNLLRKVNSRV